MLALEAHKTSADRYETRRTHLDENCKLSTFQKTRFLAERSRVEVKEVQDLDQHKQVHLADHVHPIRLISVRLSCPLHLDLLQGCKLLVHLPESGQLRVERGLQHLHQHDDLVCRPDELRACLPSRDP